MAFLNCFCIHWNCDCFWAAITALATIGLVIVGYVQLKGLKDTNKGNLLHDLKKDFFTAEERRLLFLIERDSLLFLLNDLKSTNGTQLKSAFFMSVLNESELIFIEDEVLRERKYYTTNEIDDFLLMHLEDLSLLYKQKIITLYDVEQAFGYYIDLLYSYKPIRDYIKWAREEAGDEEIYRGFESLALKLEKRKPSKL